MSDGGGAEPPQVTRDSADRSCAFGLASSTAFNPCQMVGTPADSVTRSCAINAAKRSGAMNRCGITCLQPSINAAHGMPQPMA